MLKHVTTGGAHPRGLASWQHSFEERRSSGEPSATLCSICSFWETNPTLIAMCLTIGQLAG